MMKSVSEPVKRTSEIMRSLGHPSRIEIIRLLSAKKARKMTVTEIHEALGLSQPETSRHLSIMKNGMVLKCEKSGAHVYYSVNDQHPLINSLAGYFKSL